MHLKHPVTAFALLLAALPFAAQAQSIEAQAQICAACHGDDGVPPQQAFPVPVIWGQNLGYLFLQLRDFKSGARKNEQMTPIAEGLDSADLMPLAIHFAKKAWPKRQRPDPPADTAEVARRVSTAAVCTACHLQGFRGDSIQPRLAGQEPGYLVKTMTDFASGARGNNLGMTGFMKGLTEREINCVAAWLAGM